MRGNKGRKRREKERRKRRREKERCKRRREEERRKRRDVRGGRTISSEANDSSGDSVPPGA